MVLAKRGQEDFSALISNKESLEKLESIVDPRDIKVMESLRRWEKPSESKNSRLRVNKSFRFCLDIMENGQRNRNDTQQVEATVIGNPNSIISKLLGQNKNTLESVKPIILIPDELLPGNLSLGNARNFFTEGRYEAMDALPVDAHSFEYTIELLGRRIGVEVWNDVNLLRSKRKLGHVVAIFAKGNPYQFKGVEEIWGDANIAKLFKRVRGYLLTYTDIPLHPIVQKWNVRILRIDRTARHKDQMVYQEFMEDFRQFLLRVD